MQTGGRRRKGLRKSGRASLTGYNCDGALLLPNEQHQGQSAVSCDTGSACSTTAAPSASFGSSSTTTTPPSCGLSEAEVELPVDAECETIGQRGAPGRGPVRSRRSPGNRELRGRTRMSLAGYNCIGAVSIIAEDCSSTRDSTHGDGESSILSEADSMIKEPWDVLRKWARDTLSDRSRGGDDSDADADSEVWNSPNTRSPRTSLVPRNATRRSMRVASRASLAGYSCQGAKSSSQMKSSPLCEAGSGPDSAMPDGSSPGGASVGVQGMDRGDRLSTIGETLNMGISQWFGETDDRHVSDGGQEDDASQVFNMDDSHPLDVFDLHAGPNSERRSSIERSYEALDGAAAAPGNTETWQQMLFGNDDDEDETLEMGLQDDPIAEAGFVFAVEYSRSYAYATTHHVRERRSSSESD